MRPKKQILLVNADEIGLSLERLRFTLLGYQVYSALTGREAVQMAELYPGILVAVITMTGVRWSALIEEIKTIIPDIRIILTSGLVRTGEIEHQADCCLGVEDFSLKALRDWVGVLAARKRGPKNPVAVAGPAVKEIVVGA